MKNKNIKRILVLLIINLVICVSITPNFYANDTKTFNVRGNDYFDIIITEYKSDGSSEKIIKSISQKQAEQLVRDLKEVKDLEEVLTLYQNYGLISKDVTVEQLRVGMEKKKQSLGLTQEKLNELSSEMNTFMNKRLFFSGFFEKRATNYLCSVSILFMFSLKLFFGLSVLTAIINFLLDTYFDISFYIPSIDLLDICVSFLGSFSAKNGIKPDIDGSGILAFIMAGFVGFHFSFPPRIFVSALNEFVGFSAFAGFMWSEIDFPSY